jgi:hypothetical protein
LFQPLLHRAGHDLWLPNVLERISQPSCKLLYAVNTSFCKEEMLLISFTLILPAKRNKKGGRGKKIKKKENDCCSEGISTYQQLKKKSAATAPNTVLTSAHTQMT